jgi:Zn finger protein HypA/HybF involved in hydrogenase expression
MVMGPIIRCKKCKAHIIKPDILYKGSGKILGCPNCKSYELEEKMEEIVNVIKCKLCGVLITKPEIKYMGVGKITVCPNCGRHEYSV